MSQEKNILIIDDDQILCRQLSKLFKSRGINAQYEHWSSNALKLIKTIKFDLIILDMNLPGLNGQRLLFLIRELFPANDLPVIMLTSSEKDEDIVNCLRGGANDFINKSSIFDIIWARVQTQLTLSDLAAESIKKNQIEALAALVVTLNHEINNSLFIAINYFNQIKKDNNLDEKAVMRITEAHDKIKEITHKIKAINEDSNIEFEYYSGDTKMVKI